MQAKPFKQYPTGLVPVDVGLITTPRTNPDILVRDAATVGAKPENHRHNDGGDLLASSVR